VPCQTTTREEEELVAEAFCAALRASILVGMQKGLRRMMNSVKAKRK
jgi:hypothetical protein